MKQVVQNFRSGQLKVEELPPPALRPGGVLVRTAFSLISAGTERTIVETAQSSLIGKARSRPDLVRQVVDTFKREGLSSTYEKVKARLSQTKELGYSAAGTVVEVGSKVAEFRVGDRVACAGVGYASHAEVIYVPKNLCCKIPEAASLEAACYTTVGAIALQGIRQADPRLGEAVAVIGLGLVGQLTVQLLKAAGCRVLGIDIDRSACELATKSGADVVADSASAQAACAALTEGHGADCIVITAASKTSEPIELAAELARDRARVVVVGLVGMDVPRNLFYAKEIELRLSRSYGPGRYDAEYEEKGTDYPIGYVRWTENRNMEAFLHLVAEGKVNTDLLTTHRFEVERAAEAYDLILNRGQRYCGIVLEYPQRNSAKTAETAKTPKTAKPLAGGELGISFIGAGNFARGVLLPIVKRQAKLQLVAVGAATGLSAKNTAEQFGFSYSTTDYQEILSDQKSQLVFIATRHDSHAQMAAEALRHGKHVFVEKPLAITEESLREVIAAARVSNRLLMVGYNRRFAPIAKEIKASFSSRSGPMTIVYRVNAGELASDHWTHDSDEGGGRILGEVCHFIDFVQYLTDALPVRVNAERVSRRAAGAVDDSVVISMSMSDGSISSIVYAASGDSSLGKEHVEIFCDGSVATIDDFKSGALIRNRKTTRLGGRAQDKGHAAEIAAFVEATRAGGDSPIGLESLAATTLASLAAVESANTGSTVSVDLNSVYR